MTNRVMAFIQQVDRWITSILRVLVGILCVTTSTFLFGLALWPGQIMRPLPIRDWLQERSVILCMSLAMAFCGWMSYKFDGPRNLPKEGTEGK